MLPGDAGARVSRRAASRICGSDRGRADVLGADAHAEQARGQALQHRHRGDEERIGSGTSSAALAPPSTGTRTLFWMPTCAACVALVGQQAARLDRGEVALRRARPSRSCAASRLAAATASWIARLMPTPPTGDIACAASPMQSRPGRYHCVRRSTATVSSLTSSQLAGPRAMRAASNGAACDDLRRGTPRGPRAGAPRRRPSR